MAINIASDDGFVYHSNRTETLTFLQNFVDRFSPIMWMVTFIHLSWGFVFLNQGLPATCPFPGAFPFYHGEVSGDYWGYTLLVVSLISIAGNFVKSPLFGILSVIPQQLIVMYGVVVFIPAVIAGEDTNLLLAAGWFIPAAIFHTIALLQRYPTEKKRQLYRTINKLPQ